MGKLYGIGKRDSTVNGDKDGDVIFLRIGSPMNEINMRKSEEDGNRRIGHLMIDREVQFAELRSKVRRKGSNHGEA